MRKYLSAQPFSKSTGPLPRVDRDRHLLLAAGAAQVTIPEALVHMKLSSHRDKDRTHLRDLIEVGLVDRSWLAKLPPELAERLRGILGTPDS
jgi:hypothetical protein